MKTRTRSRTRVGVHVTAFSDLSARKNHDGSIAFASIDEVELYGEPKRVAAVLRSLLARIEQ